LRALHPVLAQLGDAVLELVHLPVLLREPLNEHGDFLPALLALLHQVLEDLLRLPFELGQASLRGLERLAQELGDLHAALVGH